MNDDIHQEQMREMAILNSLEDGNTSPSPAGTEQQPPPPPTFARGRGRARVTSIQGAGRGGVHITRQGQVIRRVPQGHHTISMAARSAAGLPSQSVQRQAPGAIDHFGVSGF